MSLLWFALLAVLGVARGVEQGDENMTELLGHQSMNVRTVLFKVKSLYKKRVEIIS